MDDTAQGKDTYEATVIPAKQELPDPPSSLEPTAPVYVQGTAHAAGESK